MNSFILLFSLHFSGAVPFTMGMSDWTQQANGVWVHPERGAWCYTEQRGWMCIAGPRAPRNVDFSGWAFIASVIYGLLAAGVLGGVCGFFGVHLPSGVYQGVGAIVILVTYAVSAK